MPRFGFWAGAAASIAAAACQPDARVWQPSAPIEIEQPAHFGSRATWSEGMTPTHASVALGELLFNDEELSADGSISCATCHQSQAAFSDLGARLSVGVYNRLGRRNTPPIQNVLWMPFFMWDGGITNLEVMPMAPITNYAEHDLNLLGQANPRITGISRMLAIINLFLILHFFKLKNFYFKNFLLFFLLLSTILFFFYAI